LPTGTTDLENAYSAQDYLDVNVADDTRVGQTATQEYMVHQFKDYVGNVSGCQLNWEGQSTLAPTSSTVYLQIFNRNTSTWDMVDSDNTSNADTDFVLSVLVESLTNYKDESNVIVCRVYQLAI